MCKSLSLLSLLLCLQLSSCQSQEAPPPATTPTVSFSLSPPAEVLAHRPLFISTDHGQHWADASYNLPADLQVSFLELRENEIVLASDNMGIYLSTNSRTHWEEIGAALPSKKINSLHLADHLIYAGAYRKGIFRTSNEGQDWENLNFDLPNLSVQSIFTIDNRVLAGTDDGIFLLEDGQATWEATNLKAQVLSIYEYGGSLIAGTSQGTARSLDQGKSWEWIRKKGAAHYTHNIGPRIIELAISGDLVYSDDEGQSWQKATYGPTGGSYVYEIIENGPYQLLSNNYGVHRSSDQGQSWQLIFPIETMAFFDFLLIDDTLYGGTRVWDEFRGRERN